MVPIRQHTKKLLAALLAAFGITMVFGVVQFLGNGKISFSHPSGFYDDAFEVEIKCGTIYDIYYTLDGSEPTIESIPYRRGEPILITDASLKPNRYTADLSIAPKDYPQFLDDLGVVKPAYQTPSQNVDKCTVIRAAAFADGKRIGDSVCNVYFVGWNHRPEYKDAYIVSLVAEPDDLFGYEKGIMATGKLFDDYLAELEETYLAAPDQELKLRGWWWWPANYHQTGMDWERPANITVFNQNHVKEMDQTCGIRIHGGASRGVLLKSVRCYARREYSGQDFFDVAWFGEDIHPNKFLLFSGGNESTINIKDHMISQLSQDMNFATMDFIPCALFINGEFWGFYQITEHYGAKYIADHYSVHENNILMVKNGELAEGSEQDMVLYDEMKDFITGHDMSDPEQYRQACEIIDIDSFIDYYALQIYIARRGDWPHSNFALWRTIEQEAGAYGDGKWRWMLFDANSLGMTSTTNDLLKFNMSSSSKYDFLEEDSLERVYYGDPVFASLYQSHEFQKKFAERILYVGSTVLSSKKCSAFIDAFFADYGGLLQNTRIRTFDSPDEKLFEVYSSNLKHFFKNRFDVVYGLLDKHLDSEVPLP